MLLTQREWQVAGLLVHGLTDKKIALSLRIATNTVKCHQRSIRYKLRAQNRVEVALLIASDPDVSSIGDCED